MTRLAWSVGIAVLICSTHAAAQAPVADPVPPPPPAPVLVVESQSPAPPPPAPAPVVVMMQVPQIPQGPARTPKQIRDTSLTISPFHLLGPVVEVTLEVRVSDSVGVAFVAGYGRLNFNATDGELRTFTVYELGTSIRYYAVGDFDGGMQLGAEVLWAHAVLDSSTSGSDVGATGAGVGVGPMIGYKYTADVGFTFDGQVGVQWLAFRGQAASSADTTTADQSSIIPLLNLNIGWSF